MVRFYRVLGTAANLFMFYLTWRWFRDGLNLEFGLGCLVVSLYAIAFTHPQLRHLFRTYWNIKARLQVVIPMVWSVAFAVAAIAGSDVLWIRLAAGAALIYWGWIFYCFRRNKRHYVKQGDGPLPKAGWVNPPEAAARVGDCMLTSGCVASKEHQSVGHAELIVQIDEQLMLVSSWMGSGLVVNPLERIFKDGTHHWVLLRPETPWMPEEIAAAEMAVKTCIRQQNGYVERNRALRDRILARLPLPSATIEWLRKKFPIDGYNWWGLLTSYRFADTWTCIGLVWEIQWRIGRVFRWPGTLFFGFGPLAADRLLEEPSIRLLVEKDRLEFEAQQATVPGAAAVTP